MLWHEATSVCNDCIKQCWIGVFVINVTNPLAPSVATTKKFGFDINEVSVLQM